MKHDHSLKVLHINDIAYAPSEMIKSLRANGVTADLLDYRIRKKSKTVVPILCNKFISIIKYPVKLENYDIVHLHYPPTILGIATLLRSPKNLIVHLHGTDARKSQKNPFFDMILRLAGKRSKMFLYSTKDIRKIAEKYQKNSMHLPNPIDTELFRPMKNKQKNRVLILAALHRFKKVEIALNAAKKLKNIEFDVICHGPKEDMEYYKQWNGDNIHFINRVDYSELPELISKYPLIIGQFSGEVGITELQAMSCGKPMIMYSNVKIPILNAKTTEDVVRLVKSNMNNKKLGIIARKWIINNYDTMLISRRLIEIYQNLLNKSEKYNNK